MRIICYNINCLLNKELSTIIKSLEYPDVIAFSESKISQNVWNASSEEIRQEFADLGYTNTFVSISEERPCYAGVVVVVKTGINCKDITLPTDVLEFTGRNVVVEFDEFIGIFVYSMNSGRDLKRLELRTNSFDGYIFNMIKQMQEIKPVLFGGDLNIILDERDIWNPQKNKRLAGFTVEERTSFQRGMKETNLVDAYRYFHSNTIQYTFFSSYRRSNRIDNKGFRLDYFLVDSRFMSKLQSCKILNNILDISDHDPIELELL